MSPDVPEPSTAVDAAGEAMLGAAATQLRDHVDDRWVEMVDRVVARALLVSRPSWPVRAMAASGPVLVAEQVLVAYVRDSVDPVDDCEVVNVQIVTEAGVCTEVTIAIDVRYGAPLVALADEVRRRAEERLAQLLGPLTPRVSVSQLHVHVADVTRGDPKV